MVTPAGRMGLRAVQNYHQLLESSDDTLARNHQQLSHELNRVQLVFGGRLLSPYLRPHFVSREEFERIRTVCERLWRSINVVAENALTDSEMRRYLGLTDAELRLIEIDPGFKGVSRTSRLDSFITDESFQFVELNAESPAGIAYADIASEIFWNLDLMVTFRKRFCLSALGGRQSLLDVLLAAYREFAPGAPSPKIAIVDYRGLPTEREFQLFQDFFESKGYRTIIADPGELEYSHGRLRRAEFEIDLVYKRVLVNEYLEKLSDAPALWEAYRDHAVCLVNSFRGKIIHKKLLFGVLTDERFEHYFADEREFILRHIPWSRRLEARRTYFRGRSIDLVEWARRNRERLVLKPNDEYGGKGISIGWNCSAEEWEQAIESALGGHYILQERVATAREIFPCVTGGGIIEFAEQLVDLDPLLFDGQVGSAFARLSSSELCNVTAGGGMVPTFIIEGALA